MIRTKLISIPIKLVSNPAKLFGANKTYLDEISHLGDAVPWLPVRTFSLAGIQGTYTRVSFINNHSVLFWDRFFAITSLLLALYAATKSVQNDQRLRINWGKLGCHASGALFVTLMSECVPNQWLYCVVHSMWHIIAFHMAHQIFQIPKQSSLYVIANM